MAGMCGLVGGGQGAAGALDAMLAAMADYGAEGKAWCGRGCGLGLRHQAENAAAQLQSAGSGLAITAAARLDDRDALCDALGLPPAGRAAHSDRDLILAAYRLWGQECPSRLFGDYAFAIWDAAKGRLFCARDPVGVQPFYYAQTPRGFAFASAVEAVLAAPGVPGELDEIMVRSYLTSDPTTTTRTFFQAVRKLPPGHSMVVKGGALRLRRHWRPEESPRLPPASDDDYAEQFLHLYRQAVRDRLHGPDPMGTHLSGGLDSSSIAVLAARELRRQGRPPPLAFMWQPSLEEGPPEAEAYWRADYAAVAAVAQQEGLQVFHGRWRSTANLVARLREDSAFPGPTASGRELIIQPQAAAQGVRVMLSGWGGDQGVSNFGTGLTAALLLSGRWREFAANMQLVGGRPVRSAVHTLIRHTPYGPELHLALRLLVKRLRGAPVKPKGVVINPAFARKVRPMASPRTIRVGVRRSMLATLRSGVLAMRTENWTASGARHGLEYRYPLLDRRLLEFALGLPPEQFRRPEAARWLMRHALSLDKPSGEPFGQPFGEPCPHSNAPILPPQVCWDQSKGIPVTTPPVSPESPLLTALPSIRRELAAASPSRARYIDLARLLEHLDLLGATRREEQRFMAFEVFHAVQLLDFASKSPRGKCSPTAPS